MIPQRNISLIADTLVTASGRRIPEAVIERDYVLAWFLTDPGFRKAWGDYRLVTRAPGWDFYERRG